MVTIRGTTAAETGRGAGTAVTVATETCTMEVVVVAVVVVIIVGTTQEEVEEEEEETTEAAVIEVLVSIIIIWFLCTFNFLGRPNYMYNNRSGGRGGGAGGSGYRANVRPTPQ